MFLLLSVEIGVVVVGLILKISWFCLAFGLFFILAGDFFVYVGFSPINCVGV